MSVRPSVPATPSIAVRVTGSVRSFAGAVWRGHRPLALVTAASVALLLVLLPLGLIDGRLVTGAPVWLKPAKFAASVAVMSPVLAWILGQLRGDARARRLHAAGTLMATVAALELGIITAQAARGVPSHFNAATPLDAALFSIMGIAITALWLAQGYVLLRALRHPFASPVRAWGIRFGLAGALLGGAVGFIMPRPTPAQVQSLRAGRTPPVVGAHAVGVPDGGPGLPLTRWSTEGGDLRAPHFLGLHALQLLPLAAFALERRRRRSARPVIALGVGWLGLTAVALWQALRGQPLLAPDAMTLTAALSVVTVAFGVAATRRHRDGEAAVGAPPPAPAVGAGGAVTAQGA